MGSGRTHFLRAFLSELKQNAQINMNGVTHIAILESLDYGVCTCCVWLRYLLIDQMQHILLHGVMLVLWYSSNDHGILSTTRLVNRPVRECVNDMQRIRQGDYGFRLRFSKAKEMQRFRRG